MRLSELMHPDGDPRAPSQEVWDALSPEERHEVLALLPSELSEAELALLLGADEFIERLERLLAQVTAQADEETASGREASALRVVLERRLAETQAELERLRKAR